MFYLSWQKKNKPKLHIPRCTPVHRITIIDFWLFSECIIELHTIPMLAVWLVGKLRKLLALAGWYFWLVFFLGGTYLRFDGNPLYSQKGG
jgi:hypothetical protein